MKDEHFQWERVALSAILLFFFTDPAPTEIYTLSLHDALPIYNSDQFPWFVTQSVTISKPVPRSGIGVGTWDWCPPCSGKIRGGSAQGCTWRLLSGTRRRKPRTGS